MLQLICPTPRPLPCCPSLHLYVRRTTLGDLAAAFKSLSIWEGVNGSKSQVDRGMHQQADAL